MEMFILILFAVTIIFWCLAKRYKDDGYTVIANMTLLVAIVMGIYGLSQHF